MKKGRAIENNVGDLGRAPMIRGLCTPGQSLGVTADRGDATGELEMGEGRRDKY